MNYILLFLLLGIFMIISLIFLGKPQSISLSIMSFLDSFEKTDYNDGGRVKQDFLAWNDKEYAIKAVYSVYYRWQKNPFNWKHKISIKLENIKLPAGFQLSSKKIEEWNETPSDYELELIDSSGFLIKIEQIDNHINLSQHQLVKFTVNVIVRGTNIRKTIPYEFLIGEDLGDSWIAFDTGTTATTIAFKNNEGDITIAKNREENLLTPSVLIYDKQNTNSLLYGEKAETRIRTTTKYIGFRSIKKMLGYKDTNTEIGKTGKDIAAELVNNIFNDIKKNNLSIQNGKRAVVAIPNNYTATRINDMLFCIENLKQFKEIRLIYEPEAIVFYYMSNKSKLEEEFDCKRKDGNETILVFDMGGATINATIANICKRNKDTYEVNILSKIGYGIGGDSIDYCILKSIFDFETEIPELQQINIFNKAVAEKLPKDAYNYIRELLIDLSLKMKKKIVENQKKAELLLASDLEKYLNEVFTDILNNDSFRFLILKQFNKYVSIDVEGDFYQMFKSKSRFCILRNKYFSNLIYDSVMDAMNEVLNFADNVENLKIDKIILAGRSSSFPNIENNISNSFPYSPDLIDLNKIGAAKTAVVEGACWYGLNNNCIKLSNLKTSANFGFVKTKSPDKANIRFETLINAGQNFTDREGQIKFTEKIIGYNDRFNYDENKVNFYQVMGGKPETIIANSQKHKYNKVASIKISQESEKIRMRVNENDDVNCSVKLISDKTIKEKGIVADQEITDANEEHYYWIVN